MSTRLRPGSVVKDFTVERVLNVGASAISYQARRGDEQVFLKQYKVPSPRTPWYREFIDYQGEIRNRIDGSDASRFCYRVVDQFEHKAGSNSYFQAFEFFDKGHDLQPILDRLREGHAPVSFAQRMTLAKVLVAGIAALHEVGIVHCDLKPPNVQLLIDHTIAAKFALKLIDMDFSVLADRRAPWDRPDDGQGYVGSPNYFSPEHLRFTHTPESPRPMPASDVFSCSLILYELLSDGHPYAADDPEAYSRAVLSHAAKAPNLRDAFSDPSLSSRLSEILHRGLSPEPAERPTAVEMQSALRGTAAAPEPTTANVLILTPASGKAIRIAVRTEVGKGLLGRLGAEAGFFDTIQFVIERRDSHWVVVPGAATTNQTLLNGRAIRSAAELKSGDILAAGNEARRTAKLPLTVRFEP